MFISLVKPGFTAVNDLPYVTLYRTNHFVFRCYHLLYSLCIRIHYFCLCKYARGTFVSLFPFRHIICRETRSASSDLKLRDFSHYLYNISRPRSRNTFRHVPSEGIRLLYWLSYKQFPAGLLFHVNWILQIAWHGVYVRFGLPVRQITLLWHWIGKFARK